MIHPVLIYHAQHNHALQFPHQRRSVRANTECGLSGFVSLLCNVFHHFGQLFSRNRPVKRGDLQSAGRQEQLGERSERFIELLLGLRRLSVQAVRHGGGDKFTDHPHNLLLKIFPVKHFAAFPVNNAALLVHNVVVFQNSLSGLEVAGFHGLLGLLNCI